MADLQLGGEVVRLVKPRAELGRRLWTSFPDLFPHVIRATRAPGDSRWAGQAGGSTEIRV